VLAHPEWLHGVAGGIQTSHVANGSHARAGQALNSGTVVLDDGTSATLDGEDAGNLEDDVCCRSQFAVLQTYYCQ
jgi:hypothetical protein